MHEQTTATPPEFSDFRIATPQLIERAMRPPDLQEENAAFRELALALAADPINFLDKLVKVAARLCRAETVGISIEETDLGGSKYFRWVAIEGELKDWVGGTMPRKFSPCGVCVDRQQPLLVTGLLAAKASSKRSIPPLVEALLIPWGVGEGPVGTLWLVSHNDSRRFDLQDVRVLSSLAGFACGAILLQHKIQEAERIDASLRMTTAMAHHINNPLQAALLAVCQLRNSTLDAEGARAIDLLEGELLRVIKLSSELLRSNVELGSKY